MLHNDPTQAAGTRPDSIMNIFGFNAYNGGFDILSQYKPLNIGITMMSPRDPATGAIVAGYPQDQVVALIGVWLEGFPLQFDVTGAGEMTMTQSVSATFASIQAA